jgi:hypothetical protein
MPTFLTFWRGKRTPASARGANIASVRTAVDQAQSAAESVLTAEAIALSTAAEVATPAPTAVVPPAGAASSVASASPVPAQPPTAPTLLRQPVLSVAAEAAAHAPSADAGAVAGAADLAASADDESLVALALRLSPALPTIQTALAALRAAIPAQADLADALQSAATIALNIVEHPTEQKYRVLKRGNARFDRSLGRHGLAAEQLLRCGGFTPVLIPAGPGVGSDAAPPTAALEFEPTPVHDAQLRGLLAALQHELRQLQ